MSYTPVSDTIEIDSEAHFKRFPSFLVAFSLIWLGVLAPFDQLWATAHALPGSLVPPSTALISFLLGAALFMAPSLSTSSRILALGALIVCVYRATAEITLDTLPAIFEPALPVRPDAMLSLLLGLLSLAIICASLGTVWRRAARVMSFMVIVGCLALTLSPSWLVPDLHKHAGFAGLEVLLGVLAAGATWAISRRPNGSPVIRYRGVATIGIIGAFISVLGWYAVTEQGRSNTYDFAQTVTTRVQESLQREVNDQMALIERMGRRWDALDTMPPATLVNEELLSYLSHIYTLNFMAVIDEDHTFHWAQGGNGGTRAWLAKYLGTPEVSMWLAHAHLNARGQIRSIDSATSSAPRSVIAIPLTSAPMKGWTILAIQDLPTLVSKGLGPTQGAIRFRVQEGQRVLYDGVGSRGRLTPIADTTMHLAQGLSWTLSSWHVQPWTQPMTLLPDLILLICLAFTHIMIGLRKQAMVLYHRSQQLYHSTLHHSLTGLPNKIFLEKKLAEICESPGRGPIWLAIFELDGVKLINDTLGHGAGDYALKEATRRIVTEVNDRGFIAQIESDEFIIATKNTSREAITDLVNRLLERLAAPYYFDNMVLRLTASAGLTNRRLHVDDPMELVSEADLALAHAKRKAPGIWREYSSDLSAVVAERLQLRNELQHALDNNAFALHYQPIIERATGKVVAVEALMRWHHPSLGVISPAKFIPVAEDTGQINPLTNWVLDRACRDMVALRARKIADFHVAVNISPLVFDRSDFINNVSTTLARHALPAQCLELEITEGTMLSDETLTITKLKVLNILGVRTSIDDFGTGYSSLNYLKKLPIDKVKIDKSFVSELSSGSDDAAIVKAIIGLAHHLNMKVVAEGVETEAQYHFLDDQACDTFQGYLFAKPLPLDELTQWLIDNKGIQTLPQAKPVVLP